MRRARAFSFALTLLAGPLCHARDLAVIVNKSNATSKVSAADLELRPDPEVVSPQGVRRAENHVSTHISLPIRESMADGMFSHPILRFLRDLP
jgi:hypothetical protein